jgi:alanyl-tRNA synthetase
LIDGIEKRLDEIKSLRDELKTLRARAAVGQAGSLASAAVSGVVVARVDGLAPGDVRDLALAVRATEGVRAVVLGGVTDTGGVSLVSAVRPDSGLEAGALIKDAAKAVGGGGGGKGDIATAGGKNPEGLDEALSLARSAAGI